jgi:hypothetical protein
MRPVAHGGGIRPPSWVLAAVVLGLLFTVGPGEVAAQEEQEDAGRSWWSLWSVPAGRDRVIPFMTSAHVHSDTREGWSNDLAFALIYRSVYGATFRTSHGPRAWTLGLERSWLSRDSGAFGSMLGFRAGLMYGYDEELGWLAGDVPVLPFFQPIVYLQAGPLAMDVGYAWVVLSVTGAVRF